MAEPLKGPLRNARRAARRVEIRLLQESRIRRYLHAPGPKLLHLGAGSNSLPGWLSSDLDPKTRTAIQLDATKPFPFEGASFDYVFSEHMIEHLTWPDGQHMLAECSRVLRPGGVLRVATPDLRVLLGLYRGEHGEAGDAYMRWLTQTFVSEAPEVHPVFVLNAAFRKWGHKFLYDEEVLDGSLRRAGFTAIERRRPGESLHPRLRGLESHGAAVGSEEMMRFETMVLEASAPGELKPSPNA